MQLEKLKALMLRHGAVLLRGGDVRGPEDFAAVCNSLNCEAYDHIGGARAGLLGGGATPVISSAEVADIVAR